MRLATFRTAGVPTWGVIDGDEAIDVGVVLRDRYPNLKSVIAAAAWLEVRDVAAKAPRNKLF
jgi:hypothetical protein